MRKVFASMTAVSMAAAVMLAGCGSNSSDKKTTTAASTKATEAATEKKTEAATEKKTEAATEKETEKVSSEEASSGKFLQKRLLLRKHIVRQLLRKQKQRQMKMQKFVLLILT